MIKIIYAYDILLNFQKNFYDFFDWNFKDKIYHIKKIPIFKVSNKDFIAFKYDTVQFNSELLNKIYNKTIVFSKNKSFINYAFLVSNGKEIIALKLNKKGLNLYKSALLLEEEIDIFNLPGVIKTNLEYKIIHKKRKLIFQTRNEQRMLNFVLKKLNFLYFSNEFEKLKYLYLECFNEQENDLKIIVESLKNNSLDSKKLLTMYDFFKLTEQK